MHHFKVKEKHSIEQRTILNPTELKDQTTQKPNQTHAVSEE